MSVIIIGGGMAGATLALAISHATQGRLAIDLVEAVAPDGEQHPGFDNRSIALSQGTCQAFEQIGAGIVLNGGAAIDSIHVSDRGHFGRVSLSAEAFSLPAFGRVIELHDVGRKLFSLLQQCENVRLHCPAKMTAVKRSVDAIEVTLDNGRALSAQLAVAADGSRSALATAADIQWQSLDYQQCAVIANVAVTNPLPGAAFERFTQHGPLALLPLSGDRYSLVWCHDLERQGTIEHWSDERFIAELQKEFGGRLGVIEKVGQRHYYPLTLRYAARQTGHRIALVSNASQTLHPIAGQGFNLGMRDVMGLAQTLADAVKNGQDLGGYLTLRRYQQMRDSDRLAAISMTDGLIRLFTGSDPALAGVRNTAMWLMNNSRYLQGRLVRQTIGRFKR